MGKPVSVYDLALPTAFPHCLVVSRFHVARIVELLASADHRYRNGSSFAVTMDSAHDTVKLWVSAVSLERLRKSELWGPHVTDNGGWRLTCD